MVGLGSDVAHDDSSSDTKLPIVFPSATTQGAGASSSRSLTADVNVRADNDSLEASSDTVELDLQSLYSTIDSSSYI